MEFQWLGKGVKGWRTWKWLMSWCERFFKYVVDFVSELILFGGGEVGVWVASELVDKLRGFLELEEMVWVLEQQNE